MRFWGNNIEIDGSFYTTAMGQSFMPTATEMATLKASRSYFQFEGDVETFEKTVQDMLRSIESNRVGQILISKINRAGRTVRIIPLTGKEEFWEHKRLQAIPVGRFEKTGWESVIWFEPWSNVPNLGGPSGTSPYQILVHELQHSVRHLWGKVYVDRTPLKDATNRVTFPNAEELFSVMIEDLYLSSAGQPQRMVKEYDPPVLMGGWTDREFYRQYQTQIDVWCKDFPDMAGQLEGIAGVWNPIRIRRGL
jgi:hypothetical protein